MPVFSAIIILGLPLAVILAWAFELTPGGVKPTSTVNANESITQGTGQRLNLVITGVMALAIAFLVIDNYIMEDELVVVTEIASTQATVEGRVETAAPVVVEEQRQLLPNSVAVLPFENLSPDPNNAYFASGIHDTILNELAKINDVNVIARTTMLRYEESDKSLSEIADELNVETIMEGSVQYANDRVRITAQLIDPVTGSHLWSENYDRDFDDIFEIQSDIATRIAMALEAELLPEERQVIETPLTDSAEAYTLYLQAMQQIDWNFSPGNSPAKMAIFNQYLDQAIEFDEDFALAYAAKAVGYAFLMGTAFDIVTGDRSDMDELASKAREHASRALSINADTGLAYSALASVHRFNWEMSESLDDFERAYELSPNDSSLLNDYVFVLIMAGQYDNAIRLGMRLVEIDPSQYLLLELVFRITDRLDEFHALNVQGPIIANEASIHAFIALSEMARGNELEVFKRLKMAEVFFLGESRGLIHEAYLAYAYRRFNELEKALTIVENIKSKIDMSKVYDIEIPFYSYLALGENDLAFELVERHVKYRTPNLVQLVILRENFYGDPLFERPEWVALRQRINISVP